MKLTKLPKEFAEAAPLLKIEAAGYEAYFVGGSVRDTILGQPIHDVDIATSAFPAEIKALFLEPLTLASSMGRCWFCGSRRSMRSLRFERKQPIKITADPTKWILSVP